MHSHITLPQMRVRNKRKQFRRRPTFGFWVVDRDHGLVPQVGSTASIGVRRRVSQQRSGLCLRLCTAHRIRIRLSCGMAPEAGVHARASALYRELHKFSSHSQPKAM